jgi:2-amino-4-hydroxy-6-hydroxymethyldihydropteridine diphosphokinase
MSAWCDAAQAIGVNMADVPIALGGNVGDVRATFQKAISNICGMMRGVAGALVGLHDATLGRRAAGSLVNACIEIDTTLDPHAVVVHAAQDREEVRT